MLSRYFISLSLFLCNYHYIRGEEILETYCTINGNYPLRRIGENFLSLSIDPEAFLAGLNLSDTSLLLAKHFSPSHIRITGPSTGLEKYADNEDKSEHSLSDDGNNVVVTPSMWFGINEWVKLANLTPVFGISDAETAGGIWNPKSTLPLLEMSDKLNVSCYWMFGFDSSNKNESQYKQDLIIFQNILDVFQRCNDSWRIVGDLPMDDTEYVFDDLKDIINAVTWQTQKKGLLSKKKPGLNIPKSSIKFWTVSPKPEPVSFFSTLLWAEQVGTAAKMGYDIIFRHPRREEIFADTPVYWFSLLHKKLVGKSVLQAKSSSHQVGASVFAHCTKKQKNFDGRGSLTVMVVNSNPQSYEVNIKLEEMPWRKFMEVHSYILTSSNENSSITLLNGERLAPEVLLGKDPLQPEISFIKSKPYVPLTVPPMSIGFFVLPKARVPVCVNEENENTALQHVTVAENVSLSKKEKFTLQPRGSFTRDPSLQVLKRKTREQLELDEKFSKSNLKSKLDALKQKLHPESTESPTDPSRRKYAFDKNKWHDTDKEELFKRRDEMKKSIFGSRKKQNVDVNSRAKYLDLTSEETERILKDRARARAAQKNVFLTEDELDLIVEAVRRKLVKPDYKLQYSAEENMEPFVTYEEPSNHLRRSPRRPRDVNKKLLNFRTKMEERRQRLEKRMTDVVGNAENIKQNIKDTILKLKNKNPRFKRDINMELLKLKTEAQRKKAQELFKTRSKGFFKDKEAKNSAFRKSSKTSVESSKSDDDDEEDVDRVVPTMEFLTESVSSEEPEEEITDSIEKKKKPKKLNIFGKKSKTNKFDTTKLKYKKSSSEEVDNSIALLSTSDEFNDFGGELPCMYEYFGSVDKDTSEEDKVAKTLKKWNNQNKRKGKTATSSKSKTSDSTEYLRKRRSVICDDHYIRKRRSIPATEAPSGDSLGLAHNLNGLNNTETKQTGSNEDVKSKEKGPKGDAEDKTNKPPRKIHIKHRMKDLMHLEDKFGLQKDAVRHKLLLQMLGKKYLNQYRIPEGLDKEERKEIFEKLELLKEKLTYKLKDIKFQKKMEADKKGLAVTEEYVNKEDSNIVEDENENNGAFSPVDKEKRSLFKETREEFGQYKPLTPDIKEWKPSDILSLKKNVNFDGTPRIESVNNFQRFEKEATPNKHRNSRRKRRSVSFNYLDTDAYLNEIGKDSVYMVPNARMENKHYTTIVAPTENVNNVATSTVDSTDTEITISNDQVVDDLIGTADQFSTVINRLSDNIQKIPTKEEQSIIDNFINKISGFFSNIGKALGFYKRA